MTERDPRRAIPSVESLVGGEAFEPLRREHPRQRLTVVVREVIDTLRDAMADGGAASDATTRGPDWFADQARRRLASSAHAGPRRVLNATGVVLHTNLGRAPLAAAALDALRALADGYLDLEYDLETGERGSRYEHCTGLLRELSGAEAALVVNNNAAAVVLAINTLALGREVIVSRGELVEIGGSFRIPEIVERSGARLAEVGATNKTRPADYERALTPRTGAILKVHRSNFTMSGFVEEVDARTLAALGRARGVPVVHDLGSGLLLEGLSFEAGTTARAAVADGADVVTMSGDKLLGGPQAGILLASASLIVAMRANPLCRALRPDRLTLAALQATLALYRHPDVARSEIPVLRMLEAHPDELAARAAEIAARLLARGAQVSTGAGESAVGGGAAPDQRLPTTLVLVGGPDPGGSELARRLRAGDPPIVARIIDDRVALDPRTIAEDDVDALVEGVVRALGAR
ncbi:MAG TPA: L-seryl-tRNA(Sec) selenium transferase [Longimicrobiales bacterium]|nr:L-seryl-tRNA(Sec) selenium transferase [Longimicrobiales bacterium]